MSIDHSRSTRLQSEFAAILEEAKSGSDAALGKLLEDCRHYLLLMANRQIDSDLRPKAAASDLVQDTFLAAQQDFKSFEGDNQQALVAWLAQILTYRLHNNFRKYRKTQKRSVNRERPLEHNNGAPLATPKAKQETPSEFVSAVEEKVRVQRAMDELPEDYRQVLELRTWQRHSYDEIGQLLNRSPEAARKLWHRAVRQLGKHLEANE